MYAFFYVVSRGQLEIRPVCMWCVCVFFYIMVRGGGHRASDGFAMRQKAVTRGRRGVQTGACGLSTLTNGLSVLTNHRRRFVVFASQRVRAFHQNAADIRGNQTYGSKVRKQAHFPQVIQILSSKLQHNAKIKINKTMRQVRTSCE